MLLTALMTLLMTTLIPWFIWRMGAKQGKRDTELRNKQVASLSMQEQILRRQRRDTLLAVVDQSSGELHLKLLWAEINEFEAQDRELLQAAIRANVALALPGYHSGVNVSDELDQAAVDDYSAGLEVRYASERGFHAYPGLLDFVRLVTSLGHASSNIAG